MGGLPNKKAIFGKAQTAVDRMSWFEFSFQRENFSETLSNILKELPANLAFNIQTNEFLITETIYKRCPPSKWPAPVDHVFTFRAPPVRDPYVLISEWLHTAI